MTTLLIARHGNTFAPGDTVTRVGRRTDLPLVASGTAQARALGAYLDAEGLRPDAIYCGRLQRARQTAEGVVAALGATVAVEAEETFDEIDYGPDENQPESAVVARIGEPALRAWDERGVPPPGWDVSPELIERSWTTFAERVLDDHRDATVLVVTSNGVARFAPAILADPERFRREHAIKLATGAVSCFDHDGQGWTVRLWNVRP